MLKALSIAVGIVVAGVLGWSFVGSSATKNFEITVSLQVDERVLTGSSVWQTTTTRLFNPLGNGLPYRTHTRGEAVVIRIAEDLVAFALLRPEGSKRANAEYGDLLPDCGIVSPNEIASFSGGCEVFAKPAILLAVLNSQPAGLPTFVFLDDYDRSQRHISVTDVSVATTNRDVSSGIFSAFPWINALPSGYKISATTGNKIASVDNDVIYQIDFSRGVAR